MTVAYNYGTLCAQIAYELGQRYDLLTIPTGSGLALSPIQQAVQNAIAKWEREHFYFNEVETINTNNSPSLATVVGQEFYTASTWGTIKNLVHIDRIWILVSNNRYTLTPRLEQYLADTSVNPNTQGQPVDFSYYAETIRLYPIPDGVYPISIEGTQKVANLSLSTDVNFWTTDAADLIKAEAKTDLLTNILKQTDLANTQKALIYGDPGLPLETGYLDALRSENTQRTQVSKNKPTFF